MKLREKTAMSYQETKGLRLRQESPGALAHIRRAGSLGGAGPQRLGCGVALLTHLCV